jgi:folate-binding protein YgfZ
MVSLRGQMVKAFLQGYLTCNSQRIEKNAPTPMTLCNLKGRVIANGWALGDDEQVSLVVHRSLAPAVAAFLKPYAMFSKIQIQVEPAAIGIVQDPATAFCGPWAFAPDVFAPDNASGEDRSASIAQALISQPFAWISEAVSAKFLPQVLGMPEAGAVDFDKGCYLGQEIIARAQFRGAVKRGVDQFSWSGTCPAPGDSWEDAEYGSGTVIDARHSPEAPETGTGLWIRAV